MNRYAVGTVVALAVMALVHCNPAHHQNDDNLWVVMSGVVKLEKPSSMKLCGRKLTETLSLVCHGHYNKRTPIFSSYQNDIAQPSDLAQVPSEELVALTESLLRSMVNRSPDRFTRKVRTAPLECCQNTCSLTTLRSYCRDASTTNMPNMTPDSA